MNTYSGIIKKIKSKKEEIQLKKLAIDNLAQAVLDDYNELEKLCKDKEFFEEQYSFANGN